MTDDDTKRDGGGQDDMARDEPERRATGRSDAAGADAAGSGDGAPHDGEPIHMFSHSLRRAWREADELRAREDALAAAAGPEFIDPIEEAAATARLAANDDGRPDVEPEEVTDEEATAALKRMAEETPDFLLPDPDKPGRMMTAAEAWDEVQAFEKGARELAEIAERTLATMPTHEGDKQGEDEDADATDDGKRERRAGDPNGGDTDVE